MTIAKIEYLSSDTESTFSEVEKVLRRDMETVSFKGLTAEINGTYDCSMSAERAIQTAILVCGIYAELQAPLDALKAGLAKKALLTLNAILLQRGMEDMGEGKGRLVDNIDVWVFG